MKKLIGTVNVAPTPTGYAKLLMFILESGTPDAKQWAREDFIRLVKAAATINPEAWGKEKDD